MSERLTNSPAITIQDFISNAPENLELRLLAGEGGASERRLTVPRIQKLGLALAGFTNYIHTGRLQIVGQSEIWYLGQLEPEKRAEAIRHLELDRLLLDLRDGARQRLIHVRVGVSGRQSVLAPVNQNLSYLSILLDIYDDVSACSRIIKNLLYLPEMLFDVISYRRRHFHVPTSVLKLHLTLLKNCDK